MVIKVGSGYPSQPSSGNIVTMVAKFGSVCRCGALIEPGDAMSYDTLHRKSLCYVCVKRITEFGDNEVGEKMKLAATNLEQEKCQHLIERFRELRAATHLMRDQRTNEMFEILKRFKFEFTSAANVHTFIAEIAKCKHRGADCCPLKTKFHGACIHCGTVSEAGELVLYDHHTRRIHCLFCDCLRGL
jgi:hypothetical protein